MNETNSIVGQFKHPVVYTNDVRFHVPAHFEKEVHFQYSNVEIFIFAMIIVWLILLTGTKARGRE